MTKSILLIGNHLSKSGKNLSVGEDLALQLRKNGWKVHLTSSKNNKIIRLFDMLLTILLRRKEYKLAQIDVFSGQAFMWALLSGHLLQVVNKPFILSLHGGSLPKFAVKYENRVKKLLLIATHVTTPSTYLHDFFIQYRKDISLIPNGIDLKNYQYIHRDYLKPTLMWLRAFHKIYNPSMAINVLSEIKKIFPDSSLTMIGPDKKDGSLLKVVENSKKLEIEHSVHIFDQIPKKEVPEWLQKGDIFLNTTNVESFGISVIEAAACGLCIVTTNAGELSNIWENEIDALLVPTGNDLAMSEAIIKLCSDIELARKLSLNGRRKAEMFDWSNILPKWLNLFNSILSNSQ
jgi:glycosyltransferase involved in cell wall biosynthesis